MSTMTEDRVEEIAEIRTSDVPAESSHIVMVPSSETDATPQAYVLRARIEGFPVTALCGYTWTPNKDPAPLPVCSRCVDVYHQPGNHRDDREGMPDA